MDTLHLDKQITIATAEGVRIDLTLAGLATRMLAAGFDLFIYSLVLFALWIALIPTFLVASDGSDLAFSIAVMLSIFGFFAYPTAFETFYGGRTPGKKMMNIKVLTIDGYPPTFSTILTRNLLRLADVFPGFYLVGAISILASEHEQRLGDLVAGTIVVREKLNTHTDHLPIGTPDEAVWDVSQVTHEDVLAIRHFLNRSPELSIPIRNRVANEMAATILPRVRATTRSTSAEAFLRKVAYDKTNRS